MGVKVIVVGVATALGPAPRRRVDNLIASVGSVVSSSDVFTAYDGIQGVENILPMIVDSVCAGKAFVDSGILFICGLHIFQNVARTYCQFTAERIRKSRFLFSA